jgi:hypothetical protein
MSWFSNRHDPLGKEERKLRSQIAEVERQISQLEKAKKKVEQGETPPSTSNPFEDPVSLLRKRKRLFSNPEDVEKYRISGSHKDAEEPDASDGADGESSLAYSGQTNSSTPPLRSPVRQKDELSSSLNQLVRASRIDPNAPTEEETRLLKYLAAGNLEGMRKLRYEKGVARNRKIVMAIALGLLASAIYMMLKS